MAKASLESACRQLSLELAQYDIAVNSIQAGVTDTAALKKIPGKFAVLRLPSANNKINQAFMQFKGRNLGLSA